MDRHSEVAPVAGVNRRTRLKSTPRRIDPNQPSQTGRQAQRRRPRAAGLSSSSSADDSAASDVETGGTSTTHCDDHSNLSTGSGGAAATASSKAKRHGATSKLAKRWRPTPEDDAAMSVDELMELARRPRQQPPAAEPATAIDESEVYCFCRQHRTQSVMIRCENERCPVGWFHPSCVRLHRRIPPGQWYCPRCRITPNRYSKPRPDLQL